MESKPVINEKLQASIYFRLAFKLTTTNDAVKLYLLLFLFLIMAGPTFSQTIYSSNPDQATLYPTKRGAFQNYAFILNGKVIEQKALLNTPAVQLNHLFPYTITLDGKRYQGAVYFHTPSQGDLHPINNNEPAFFINNKQVSPYHIKLTNAEYYNEIKKSKRDTLIDGKLYKGTIRLYTDENFFAKRISLPDLIKKYTGLPEDKVIVHWRSTRYQYQQENQLGTLINDRFPLYSFDMSPMGVRAIEVDSILFANAVRYVVHIVDNQYQWNKTKVTTLATDPMATDTVAPCYISDFDPKEHDIFVSTEIQPQPRGGIESYLKRLAKSMNILTDDPRDNDIKDSVTVQFIVARDGKLAALQSIIPPEPEQQNILTAIKKTACLWMPALQGGRSVNAWRLITIVYSKDKKGKIKALNSISYKKVPNSPPRPLPEPEPFVKPITIVDTTLLYPKAITDFDGYTFVVNGITIDKHNLVNYPGARIGRIIPSNTREKNKPKGTIYFNTTEYPPSPAAQFANDPAYFINDIQVSPYAIRSTRVSDYNHITRSEQDTLIDGILYKGTIRIYTDEDFFSTRLAMPDIIKRYTGLSMNKVIVHWRDEYINDMNTGHVIQDHFNLYYIDLRSLQELKIDRLQFTEGERYVVHVKDQGYRFNIFNGESWGPPGRNYLIFDASHTIDPEGLCYLTSFDTKGKTIHNRAKIESRPYPNEEGYVKKLSAIMGLSSVNKGIATIRDSITVQFIVLADGQLTGLESLSTTKPGQEKLLKAIKQHSCVWSIVTDRRQYLLFSRKVVFFYDRDKKGNIRSLDRMEYRYDGK